MKHIEGFKATLSRDTHASTGAVFGAVVGGIALGALLMALCCCRRRGRAGKDTSFDPSMAMPDPTV